MDGLGKSSNGRTMGRGRPVATVSAVALLTFALSSCGASTEKVEDEGTLVVAQTLVGHPIPNIIELPGRTESVRTAEVRARVDGIVQRRLYNEGSEVSEGTPLFQIDPREKQAALDQALASLQRLRVSRANAASIVARYQPLVDRRAVSAQEYDAALSELQQADANIAQATAAVSSARLQLGYTVVRAPISGRTGRANVTEGALVSAAGATLMTSIDQFTPVYATFTQSSAQTSEILEQQRRGELKLTQLERTPVRIVLEGGREFDETGYLDFAGLTVDPSTGSQALRAKFPNSRGSLLPGQFVRGRIIAGTIPHGLSVPQRAVQISEEEANVSIVGRDNSVLVKPVELGALVDGQWIIRSGLQPGDRVIVEGWQKVRAGQKVRIEQATSVPAKH